MDQKNLLDSMVDLNEKKTISSSGLENNKKNDQALSTNDGE